MEGSSSSDFGPFDDWYNEPRVVPIVSMTSNDDRARPLKFHSEALEKFLLHENIRRLPVVVVCIAVAFRSGKSFLLNFLLRYLSAKSWQLPTLISDGDDQHPWLGTDKSASLDDGFPWHAGTESHTDGIVAWSRPIRVKRDGRECAILILDTQGTFDRKASTHQTTATFALSSLLSSVLICNVRGGHIGSDLLEQLQFFTDFGRVFAAKEAKKSNASSSNDEFVYPFQTLMLLVRDWQNPAEFAYGETGGRGYLAQCFGSSEEGAGKNKNTQQASRDLQGCFQELRCCLLPWPGDCVTDELYDGNLAELSPEFVKQIALFTELLAAIAVQTAKRIDGKEITCEELFTYASRYADLLNKTPTVRSWYETTLNAANRLGVDAAVEQYDTNMIQQMQLIDTDDVDFDALQEKAKCSAIELYKANRGLQSGDGENHAINDDLRLALHARSERFRNVVNVNAQREMRETIRELRQMIVDERTAREEHLRALTEGSQGRNLADTVLEIVKGVVTIVAEVAAVLLGRKLF